MLSRYWDSVDVLLTKVEIVHVVRVTHPVLSPPVLLFATIRVSV
jgi:hypothetical protein